MKEALVTEIKKLADTYCRDNARELEPAKFQQHIEKAISLGAALVIKHEAQKHLDCLCGMGLKSK